MKGFCAFRSVLILRSTHCHPPPRRRCPWSGPPSVSSRPDHLSKVSWCKVWLYAIPVAVVDIDHISGLVLVIAHGDSLRFASRLQWSLHTSIQEVVGPFLARLTGDLDHPDEVPHCRDEAGSQIEVDSPVYVLGGVLKQLPDIALAGDVDSRLVDCSLRLLLNTFSGMSSGLIVLSSFLEKSWNNFLTSLWLVMFMTASLVTSMTASTVTSVSSVDSIILTCQ